MKRSRRMEDGGESEAKSRLMNRIQSDFSNWQSQQRSIE